MDIDPLQDTVPPRYAIESDEEEDEFNPLGSNAPTRRRATPQIDFKLIGDTLQSAPLLFATARAGAFWAKGADLGEQAGGIYVNKIQVGLLFKPTWAEVNVLVSESFTRLPLDFMHPYAKYVVDTLKPTRASLLDSYSTPTYASLKPSPTDGPLRYISTGSPPAVKADPFEPPNLLQGTSAALLLLLNLTLASTAPPTTLILLPSPQLPVPPPKDLAPSNFPSSADHQDTWPADTMTLVSQQLLSVIDVTPVTEVVWESKHPELIVPQKVRRSEIGEGGMYL